MTDTSKLPALPERFNDRAKVAVVVGAAYVDIDPEEILRVVLYRSIHILCHGRPFRLSILCAWANGQGHLPTSLRDRLVAIAHEAVIPSLTDDERTNLERTLRVNHCDLITIDIASLPSLAHARAA